MRDFRALRSTVDIAITDAYYGVSGLKKPKLAVPDRILVPYFTKVEIELRVEKCLQEWAEEFDIGYVAAVVIARDYINEVFFELLGLSPHDSSEEDE